MCGASSKNILSIVSLKRRIYNYVAHAHTYNYSEINIESSATHRHFPKALVENHLAIASSEYHQSKCIYRKIARESQREIEPCGREGVLTSFGEIMDM